MTDFKLRNDEYGQNFYLQKDGKPYLYLIKMAIFLITVFLFRYRKVNRTEF